MKRRKPAPTIKVGAGFFLFFAAGEVEQREQAIPSHDVVVTQLGVRLEAGDALRRQVQGREDSPLLVQDAEILRTSELDAHRWDTRSSRFGLLLAIVNAFWHDSVPPSRVMKSFLDEQ